MEDQTFAETTPIWLKIVSGLEFVTSIGRLMCIAIEGPQLTEINFHQILDIYKQQNHRIPL